MKELLISLGFKLKSSCSCSGTYNETYKKQTTKGMISVIIKPSRLTWQLRIENVYQTKGNSQELEQKLKDYELI